MTDHSQPRGEGPARQTEPPDKTPAPTATPPAHEDAGVRRANRNAVLVGAAIAASAIAALGAVVYLLLQNPALTANIRDIVIILTAFVLILMSIMISVLLVILLYRVQELMRFLRAELVPILTDTQKAVKTLYGTTVFVSDNVARPAIKAAGFVSGVQRMVRVVNAKAKGGAPADSGQATRRSRHD